MKTEFCQAQVEISEWIVDKPEVIQVRPISHDNSACKKWPPRLASILDGLRATRKQREYFLIVQRTLLKLRGQSDIDQLLRFRFRRGPLTAQTTEDQLTHVRILKGQRDT